MCNRNATTIYLRASHNYSFCGNDQWIRSRDIGCKYKLFCVQVYQKTLFVVDRIKKMQASTLTH